MIKAVIFDFGGVVVNTETKRFEIIQRQLKKYGIELAKNDFTNIIGRKTKKVLEQYKDELSTNQIEDILKNYRQEYIEEVIDSIEPVQPTVDFILSSKNGLKFAIASMNSPEIINKALKRLNILEQFDVITTFRDVSHNKPDPEIYLKTVEKLKLFPKECIAIEDSPKGAQAAISAELNCYALLNSSNQEDYFRNIKISGFIRNLDDYLNAIK